MLINNDSFILILGMVHSGTTILTYLLRQHPAINLIVGPGNWLLESPYLSPRRIEELRVIAEQANGKKILLKKPLIVPYQIDWMQKELPNAKCLYCLRSFEQISESWSKPFSFVTNKLRTATKDYQKNFYEACLEKHLAMKEKMKNFRIVNHNDVLTQPSNTLAGIADWVGLTPFAWDINKVSLTINIKDVLRNPIRYPIF